jgi:hypothetical protein
MEDKEQSHALDQGEAVSLNPRKRESQREYSSDTYGLERSPTTLPVQAAEAGRQSPRQGIERTWKAARRVVAKNGGVGVGEAT